MDAPGSHSGLDEMRQVFVEGRQPSPISELVGMRLVELGSGNASWELEPALRHLNPYGSAHGSIFAALLDSAMAVGRVLGSSA